MLGRCDVTILWIGKGISLRISPSQIMWAETGICSSTDRGVPKTRVSLTFALIWGYTLGPQEPRHHVATCLYCMVRHVKIWHRVINDQSIVMLWTGSVAKTYSSYLLLQRCGDMGQTQLVYLRPQTISNCAKSCVSTMTSYLPRISKSSATPLWCSVS